MKDLDSVDVAVVGAGVAGLAAAGALRSRGFKVAVFEARDRIGGRILTHRDPRFPAPLELGAEFVHGDAPLTEAILREAGLSDFDIVGDHWRAERGRLRRFNRYTTQVDGILDRFDRRGKDRSLADYLADRPGGRALARDRTATREFVQGFHAADPHLVSVLSLLPGEGEEPTDAATRVGRIVEGYDRVPHWLARDLGDAIHLNSPVREIAWEKGRVELTVGSESGATRKVTARAAVLTLPLGVLQAPMGEPGSVRFTPDPPRLRKTLDLLAMGHVVRLVLGFHELPWKARTDLERMTFLHTPDQTFRTWWTPYPLRLPLLVAWAGGPAATAWAGKTPGETEGALLRVLSEHLGISRPRLANLLEGLWTHDWNADPLSRGAYSYARVGGNDAAKDLARPLEQTLYFAGEAADVEGRTGTVEGAIGSGLRVAKSLAKLKT